MNPAKDLTGQRFGFLTVLFRDGTSGGKAKKARWRCACDCGNEVTRESQYLRTKHRTAPRHCGCQHANKTHAMTHTRPYYSWSAMRSRCLDRRNKDYKNYGARGIKVCTRWAQSFEAFWADMGPTYLPGLTLGRKDNNGDYTPENCRWETPRQQANNTRNTIWLDTPKGRMSLEQAAGAYGLRAVTLHARLVRYKWPLERALSTPGRKQYSTSRVAARAAGL
jgi:hypothetical protein